MAQVSSSPQLELGPAEGPAQLQRLENLQENLHLSEPGEKTNRLLVTGLITDITGVITGITGVITDVITAVILLQRLLHVLLLVWAVVAVVGVGAFLSLYLSEQVTPPPRGLY